MKRFFSPGICLLLLGAWLLIGAFVIPNVIERRASGSESGTIGALKTIGQAQRAFRDGDEEGDGLTDYGTLAELAGPGTSGLIDAILGSGSKGGYLFAATYGAHTSEFIWIATARPQRPGRTGDRYFVRNHEGVTYYTTAAPFRLNSIDCQIPQGARRVGR